MARQRLQRIARPVPAAIIDDEPGTPVARDPARDLGDDGGRGRAMLEDRAGGWAGCKSGGFRRSLRRKRAVAVPVACGGGSEADSSRPKRYPGGPLCGPPGVASRPCAS